MAGTRCYVWLRSSRGRYHVYARQAISLDNSALDYKISLGKKFIALDDYESSLIIFNQIVAIGMKAKISNMRILSGDHTNTKFRREHAKMTLDKNQKKEAIEEIKKEIEPMSMGLMAKGEA